MFPPQTSSAIARSVWRGWSKLSFACAVSIRWLFRSPTAVLLGAGLLLPNLLSLATLGSVIDVGLPPRTGCILLYATLAVCARMIPFFLTAILYLAILTFDIVWTLSVSFGMRPHDLMAAVDQARRVHVLESPLYVALICVMAATTLSALFLLSRRAQLARGNIIVLFGAGLALAAADYVSNADPHYYYGGMFGRNVPVVSAADASGFRAVAGANGHNVVLVVVESLGNLLDADARARIVAPIYQPPITEKYNVSYGRIVYYGSTTSAEMRELCETRAPYSEFTKTSGGSCLPEQMHKRGYATTAVHGFYSGMFERNQWYPRIGFDKMEFGEMLVPQIKRLCGRTFRGACDADLPPLIERAAAETTRPKFIYWLTLNTHIPVVPGEALTKFGCERENNGFGLPRVCRMAELWHDVFNAVAQLALDPSIGPAEILVVGDHAPPLWSKKGRAEFEAGKVPWYRLTPREGVVAANAEPHAESVGSP
jgi:Sulfatase